LALTSSAGAIQTSYAYDPYGNTTATGTLSYNSEQYTGRENDGKGLYYYRARYYSPAYGRFISEDPIGLGGGINTYGYAGNNPVQWSDALGLKLDLAGYVLHNPFVLASLVELNADIVDMGIGNNCFTIRVTGGDRYRVVIPGVPFIAIMSSTTNAWIPTADLNSPHLIENGARAVDFNVEPNGPRCGCQLVTQSILQQALKQTAFLPQNTIWPIDYPNAPHIHVALPQQPLYMYRP